MKKWEAIFTEADRELLRRARFAKKQAFGKHPAFIIVDVNRAFVGSKPKPVLEAIEEYRSSCGESGWEALKHIQKMIAACRAKKVPVIYTTNDTYEMKFAGGPTKSVEPLDPESQQIMEQIQPLPSELVIWKTKASGFFGTCLVSALRNMNVDCLLICGTSTSGCVRATVVDGWSCQFPCFLVEECTFDRFELSHLVNLWDINAKYADVIGVDEALKLIGNLPATT